MTGANTLLIKDSLSKWARAPGFLMVLAVVLVPPALTGAWVWTHQDDIVVTGLEWDLDAPDNGDLVNFTIDVRNDFDHTTDPFNVTLRIGFYERRAATQFAPESIRWRDTHNETVNNITLGPGASTTVTINWTAEPGTFQVEAYADFFDDQIPEIEERNNYRPGQIQVRYPEVRPEIAPPPPANNTTLASRPEVNATLESVTWTPSNIFADDNVTFQALLRNDGPDDLEGARLVFQIYRVSLTGIASQVVHDATDENVSLPAGTAQTLTFDYPEAEQGLFAAFAFLDTSAVARGDNETDNVVVQQFDVQRRLVWEEPDEKATAKDFYRHDILLPVHFTLLVPLIGLFYAGGVLQDDRARGNLTYMLTRPVPRWQYPILRFASSYGIALAAVLVGVALTFMIILGTPQDATGFFWWPLGFGALVLFLYASVFTAVGVISDRPYLVGLLYVLGFETLLIAGSRILVNGAPLVQDWVLRFSLNHWVSEAYAGWDPASKGLLPESGEPMTAFMVILGIGIASLVLAAVVAKRREFDE